MKKKPGKISSADVHGSLPELTPQEQQVIAQNAMLAVYQLKMTGRLVTWAAELWHSSTFLVEVRHGERALSRAQAEYLAQVLELPFEVIAYTGRSRKGREQAMRSHLQSAGRLGPRGAILRNEDALLEKRFPKAIAKYTKELQSKKKDDWFFRTEESKEKETPALRFAAMEFSLAEIWKPLQSLQGVAGFTDDQMAQFLGVSPVLWSEAQRTGVGPLIRGAQLEVFAHYFGAPELVWYFAGEQHFDADLSQRAEEEVQILPPSLYTTGNYSLGRALVLLLEGAHFDAQLTESALQRRFTSDELAAVAAGEAPVSWVELYDLLLWLRTAMPSVTATDEFRVLRSILETVPKALMPFLRKRWDLLKEVPVVVPESAPAPEVVAPAKSEKTKRVKTPRKKAQSKRTRRKKKVAPPPLPLPAFNPIADDGEECVNPFADDAL